jgi:hypothetical protein
MPQECWTKTCTPPVWGQECCPVCVAPERHCVDYTPAQYKVIEERYIAEEGFCQEICEPPVFDTRFREVCVCPGRWEWRRDVTCAVPCPPPAPPPQEYAALEVEMKDSDAVGGEEGVFTVGQRVRYDLVISNDAGSAGMGPMRVVFSLPPELEFVEGGSEQGTRISGQGNSAASDVFSVPLDGSMRMHVLVAVRSVPANNVTKFTASVQSADGHELAVEEESTTLSAGPAGAPQPSPKRPMSPQLVR